MEEEEVFNKQGDFSTHQHSNSNSPLIRHSSSLPSSSSSSSSSSPSSFSLSSSSSSPNYDELTKLNDDQDSLCNSPQLASNNNLTNIQSIQNSYSLPYGLDQSQIKLDSNNWINNNSEFGNLNLSGLSNHQKLSLSLTLLREIPPFYLLTVQNYLNALLQRDFLTFLPLEIVVQILCFLDAKTIAIASLVSKSWHKICQDNFLWKKVFFFFFFE